MNESIRPVVGVDLGDRDSVACVYAQGNVEKWFEFGMTRDGVREAYEGKGYTSIPGFPWKLERNPAGCLAS